jgi:hypothetical protein
LISLSVLEGGRGATLRLRKREVSASAKREGRGGEERRGE